MIHVQLRCANESSNVISRSRRHTYTHVSRALRVRSMELRHSALDAAATGMSRLCEIVGWLEALKLEGLVTPAVACASTSSSISGTQCSR